MKSALAEKIRVIKDHAMANYDNGMDTFVECYTDAMYSQMLAANANSPRRTMRHMDLVAGIFRERQADAAYHAAA